jgi:hypothetical protein
MQREDFYARIREGMDVVDVNGDKLGMVGKIYEPARVSSTTSEYAEPAGELCIQVDTGFLGLGEDLYIPASAIRDVTADHVELHVSKDQLDTMGWDQKPSWIED